MPVYETAIPVLASIIVKQKTKHTRFQIMACQALCQFSASTSEPEQKEKVTVAVIEAIKNTTKSDFWKALYQVISALRDWLSPEQKALFMSDLIENMHNTTQSNHQD